MSEGSIDHSEDGGLPPTSIGGVENSRSPTESSLEHSSFKEENDFGSKSISATELEVSERIPATVTDVKNTSNLIYKYEANSILLAHL
jgi:hypothetical protein